MKKSLILAGMMSIGIAYSQEYDERVGINTQTPSATLNVKTKNNTKTPKNLELENQSGTKLVTVLNNGRVGINTEEPQDRLHILDGAAIIENGGQIGGFISLINKDKPVDTADTMSMWRIYNMTGSYGNSLQFWGYRDKIGAGTSALQNVLVLQDTGNIGMGLRTPEEKLDVNGNILTRGNVMARQGRLISRYNSNEGGAVDLINDKKTEDGDIKKWTMYNMTTPYVKGLHFWAYGPDDSSKNSQMFLTDQGQLAVGFGNARADQLSITEKLEVNGNAKIKGLRGTGDRIVYADQDGVLKVGSGSTIATNGTQSEKDMPCNDANRGKTNFVKDVALANGKTADAFAVCLKGSDGNHYWRYLYGAGGETTNTGTFGNGLQ